MEYFLNAFWSLLELVFFYFFWSDFLPWKRNRSQRLLALAAVWVFSIVYISLLPNEMLKTFVSILSLFTVSMYLFQGRWYQYILIIAISYITSGIIDFLLLYGTCTLLGISFNEFVWRKLFYAVTVSLGKLIAILLAWILQKIRKPAGYQVQGKWLLLSLLFPIISVSMLMFIYYSFQDAADLSVGALVFSIILVASNVSILYLVSVMEKSTRQLQENALLQQQMALQTDSIQALERSYRNQREMTHDYKNKLQTIQDLLANEETESAKQYVQQLQELQTTRFLPINSRHPILDAIFNHKYQTATECGIDFQMQVNDLSGVSIGTDKLVVLMTNLLDNAIEACCRLPDGRRVQCSILAEDGLFISVRNTSLPVSILDDTITTSKTPKEEHGFGLPNIKRILNDLQAEYTFGYEDGWFAFAAEIPNL